jgi:hypothetical protein
VHYALEYFLVITRKKTLDICNIFDESQENYATIITNFQQVHNYYTVLYYMFPFR